MADDRYALIIEVDARRGRDEVRGLGNDMQRTGGQATRLESGMQKFQSRILALGGAMAGIQLARKVIDVAASFEQLRTQLETVEGSVGGANRAFDQIKDFAARTPFQVQALTTSWINLRAKGFEPTMRSMTALGDLAAAFGKDVTQATQAVTQAAFGEAEMLKQFGIIMRTEGDSVKITFKGVTREVERDSGKIVAALIDIAETNFAGGMERQAKTFNGQLSTTKDLLANIADSVAELSGGFDTLKDSLSGVNSVLSSDFIAKLTRAATVFSGGNIGRAIAGGSGPWGVDISRFKEGVQAYEGMVGLGADMAKHQAKIAAEQAKAAEEAGKFALALAEAASEARQLALLSELNATAGFGSTSQFTALLDTAYEQYLERVAMVNEVGFLPTDNDDVFAAFAAKLKEAVKEAVIDAGEDAAPEFASYLSRALQDSLGRAIEYGLRSGDVEGALEGFANSAIGAFANSIGGAGGGFVGGVLGGLTDAVVRAFGSGTDFSGYRPQQVGSASLYDQASKALLGASENLENAARDMAGAIISIRAQFVSLEAMLGGSLLSTPSLDVSQINGEFHAALKEGFVPVGGGIGDTVGEAVRNALDSFAKLLPHLIREGVVDISGFDPAIQGALSETSFANFDEMTSTLQVWNDSLNAVATTLGAVTPATDATLSRLRELELSITRSGLSAERAAPFLGEIARAMDLRRQQIEADLLTGLASLMERAGINAGKAAAFRAQAEQKITQLKLIEYELAFRQAGLWTQTFATIFGQLNTWAANIHNFTVAAVRAVQPIVSAPNYGGGGGGLGSTANRDRLDDFLGSLDYSAPGTPMASKSALAAAVDAMTRASADRDSDAFISASTEALRIQKELYGSLGLGDMKDLIKSLGAFTPTEAGNPVVAAISGLGDSIGTNLGGLGADIVGAVDALSFGIDESIGANLISIRDNNKDGMIGIREAQGLMTDATFQLLDVDQSGFLSLGELSSQHALGIFRLLDSNEDGNLTLSELLGVVRNPPPPPPPINPPLTEDEMRDLLDSFLDRLSDRLGRQTEQQTIQLDAGLDDIEQELRRRPPLTQ